MKRPAAILFLSVVGASLAVACAFGGGNGPRSTSTVRPAATGAPRAFRMGVSSLPPELTDKAYQETFAHAASAGDLILIQRSVPWSDMLSGKLSDDTVKATKRDLELAHKYDLRIFFAIDPTDAAQGRGALANLPSSLLGADFSDDRVRKAFVDYARYIAQNYRPQYLALGVEINSYQRANAQDFERFVQVYHESYQAVKEIAPDTLVFPTFQLEELQGLLPLDSPQPPQWYLLQRFEPDLDVVAVSSYPSSAYSSLDRLPAQYFAQLAAYTNRPIAIAGAGYPSQPAGAQTAGSEQEQVDFVHRLLDSAQQLAMPFVVWFVSQDPTFVSGPPFDRLQSMGLLRSDGRTKPAWATWQDAARRPFAAPTGRSTPAPATPSQ